MTPPKLQVLLQNLVDDAAKACQIAKTAAGAKQSLRGEGPYAKRFHEAVIRLSTSEAKLLPGLAVLGSEGGEREDFDRALVFIKAEDATRTERSDSFKSLRLLCESVLRPKIEGMTANPIPSSEQVLPMSVVSGSRSYIEKVVVQANGTYEHHWYDACSVMIRRLVETLIIETYEAKGASDEIKKDGSFLMLGGLVDRILGQTKWNLGRETRSSLPLLKHLGDRSAHNRRFIATKQDLDRVIPGLRAVADDLLHLAGLK